ncbi:MBL fold metallo-hydrolase [Pseudoruegeria sp. SHC-113]|uniref:MBL fold metallo-hydrolase n=1 Tax=Pseudoruegeria sp. SHC-113 TaxID=2855439 RepID=UPI0021BB780E|nr:MBL fold metallo-hydrolase [Pseudoruegeria sp. SHC-113]MCT8162182.1 MBL fold metallo-hydrolase [Pseudoruegeria sp. SHC-113]
MPVSRRVFLARGLAAAGAAPALLAPAGGVLADLSLGAARLTTVSDGSLTLPRDFIFGPMPQAELAPILAAHNITGDALTPECNLALYRDGTHTVLFDAGAGPDFMPSAGQLLDSLDAAGLTPEEITHVVFTHAHPDHIWGVLDDFDDPLFPDATHMMGRREWDYWWNPETVDRIGAARATFAVGARRRMEVIEAITEFFDDGEEILPGISAVETPGHTPGHMAFELRGGGQGAMIVGDAIGNEHIAFARPGWESGSDQDMPLAAKSRSQLLDRLASEQMQIVGFHLPGGGIGRVEKGAPGEDDYRFVPA